MNFPFVWSFVICIIAYMIGFIVAVSIKVLNIPLSGFYIILPFFIITLGSGLLMPVIVGKALSQCTDSIGTAASIIGVVQNITAFAFSGLGAYLTGYFYDGIVITYAILFALLVVCFMAYSIFESYNFRYKLIGVSSGR